jgi:N-acetylglucosamine-6-phosphate deacetylase
MIVDVHTHGIGGYDSQSARPEEILRIADIHGSYGVSAIIISLCPGPEAGMRDQMGAVKTAMEIQEAGASKKTAGDGEKQPQARILGVHLEGPFLNPARSGALDRDWFLAPSERTLSRLLEGFDGLVKVITVAPELDNALALIGRMRDRGIIVSMGHSDATFGEAEAGFHAGATGVTHLFNAMRPFHHREPGLAGFGLANREIFVEVIADPYHLHPGTMDLIFHAKPKDRVLIISDSVKDTKRGQTGAVADERGTLLGGVLPVTESVRRLIRAGYGADAAMRCVVKNPMAYLGISS